MRRDDWMTWHPGWVFALAAACGFIGGLASVLVEVVFKMFR